LIAKDGDVLLSAGYGIADRGTGEVNTPETVYRVASISKPITAIAVLILQERKLLRLSDSITEYLPDAPEVWKSITIRHLLTHTSGISDYESQLEMYSPGYDDFMSRPDVPGRILAEAKAKPLRFAPGTQFEYSNTGYLVLGFIVERLGGMPFADFLQHEIFAPLGMKSTHHDRDGLQVPHRARGYEMTGEFNIKRYLAGLSPERDFAPAPEMRFASPQGDAGIISTTLDLFELDQTLSTTRLVSRPTLDEMFTPVLGNYGYGWFIGGMPGSREISHNGLLPGFASRLVRYADEHLTIILLGNTDVDVDHLTAELAAICRGKHVALPIRRTIVELKPEEYAPLLGDYLDGQGRTLTVRREAGRLTITLRGRFEGELLAVSPREFYCSVFNGPVQFEVASGGVVTGLRIELGEEIWRALRTPTSRH
jgi:CubicO group peptidase (beta-lactamase class C family)